MIRVATYHRVLPLDQYRAFPRRELRTAAGRLGKLVLEVEEVGSGARNDRPGRQRVLDLARHGGLTLDLLADFEALQAAAVRFTAVPQWLDIRPSGDFVTRFLLTALGGVAEFERDVIRERTRLGLAAARRRGIRLGGRSYPSAEQAMEVRRLLSRGSSWTEIANAAGCSMGTARRAAARGYPMVGKPGTRPSPRHSVSKRSSPAGAPSGRPEGSSPGAGRK